MSFLKNLIWVLHGYMELEMLLHFRKPYWSHEEDLNSGPGGGPPGFNNDNNEIEYYGERNGTRMDAYHRLDLGANFIKKKRMV